MIMKKETYEATMKEQNRIIKIAEEFRNDPDKKANLVYDAMPDLIKKIKEAEK